MHYRQALGCGLFAREIERGKRHVERGMGTAEKTEDGRFG